MPLLLLLLAGCCCCILCVAAAAAEVLLPHAVQPCCQPHLAAACLISAAAAAAAQQPAPKRCMQLPSGALQMSRQPLHKPRSSSNAAGASWRNSCCYCQQQVETGDAEDLAGVDQQPHQQTVQPG
jgi:hypothetical protein